MVEKNRQQLVLATEQTIMAREGEKLALAREQMTQEVLRERTELMARLARVGKHAQSGALAASIAHELNQPLAAMQLNIEETQHLMQSGTAPQLMPALLENIAKDNQRAAAIVRRVRQMFIQGSTRQQSQVLDDMVRFVLDWTKKRLNEEGVHVGLNLDAATPFQFAAGELEHILMNLIDNALDALADVAPGHRRLDIRTWREPGWVFLSVADNGPGVPEHMKDSIFELSETSKPNGMGLGLWLARYIVVRHGGQLDLSLPQAGGACFTARLPDQ